VFENELVPGEIWGRYGRYGDSIPNSRKKSLRINRYAVPAFNP